jgi:nitronate monooxygenase
MAQSKAIQQAIRSLKAQYPWTNTPLVVGAPMKSLSGPALALAIAEAGGIGFIGPGDRPEHLEQELENAIELVSKSSALGSPKTGPSEILPVGFGIQTWTGDLSITSSILRSFASRTSTPPAAAWLFAPRDGQSELDSWSRGIRASSPQTRIWIQVASVADAIAAARSKDAPDVLVIQGTDAGGHSRTKGAGIISLLPEVSDALESIPTKSGYPLPLIAAGGIADGRGVSAALVLGASGAAMGTRFLATSEAKTNPGYQSAVLAGFDGGQTTVRTQFYNHLRGTLGWPELYDARGLINASWRDHESGMPFEKNKALHDEAVKKGPDAWGREEGRTATYVGTAVGLITEVKSAGVVVKEARDEAGRLLDATCTSMN